MPWIELEPKADAARHHRPLADVDGAERGDDSRGARRVAAVRGARGDPAEHAGGRHEVGQDLVRRAHLESLGLEDGGDEAQRRVVAGADAADQPRREAQHGQIEAQQPERRPGEAAGEGDDAAAGGVQVGEEPPGRSKAARSTGWPSVQSSGTPSKATTR